MPKKYIITCGSDPYHASRSRRYEGKTILKRNGATPVLWIHDDNFGDGFTLEEARKVLDSYHREDGDYANPHRHFDMSYEIDVWTYRIEVLSNDTES